jgi:transposase
MVLVMQTDAPFWDSLVFDGIDDVDVEAVSAPVEQSSGKNQRRRLNRGGNRQTNAALYRNVVTRLRRDTHTRLYLERRTKQGNSKREIIRCLKRYVAREIYGQIQRTSALGASPAALDAT